MMFFSRIGFFLTLVTGTIVLADPAIRGGHRNVQSFGVTSFILIDVAQNKEVLEITNNMVIDKKALGLTKMNIKANVSGSVGSVKFGLNGNANFRIENVSPYAMCGDSNGIYTACSELVNGIHSVQATAYSMGSGTGVVGGSMSITFTITEGTSPTPPTAPAPVPVPAPTKAPVTVPVPVPTKAPVTIPVPVPTKAPVTVPSPVATTTDGLTNLRLINTPNTVVMDLKLNGEPNVINVAGLGLKTMDLSIMAVSTEGVVLVTFDNGKTEYVQPFARCGDSNGIFAKCLDISADGQYIVSATGKLSNGANTNTIRATIIVREKGTAAPTISLAPSMAPTTAAPTISAAPTMIKSCNVPKFVGSWQSILKYPTTVAEAQGGMIGNDFVIISGFENGFSQCTDKVYALDTANPSATWREMDKLPSSLWEGITHAASALIGSKFYMCGGYYGGHPGPAIDTCLIYDHSAPPGMKWNFFQKLPAPRAGGGMTFDRRLSALVFAGGAVRPNPKVSSSAIDKNDAWMLKLEWIGDATKTWVPVAKIPYHANHMSFATLTDARGQEHHVYVGGQVDENEFSGNVKGNWEYDYNKNQWIQLADMPSTRGHASESTRPISCGYTMSGGSTNELGKTPTVIYYDYPKNQWTTIGNLTSAVNTPVCDFVTHASTGKTWYYCNKGWSGSWRIEVVV